MPTPISYHSGPRGVLGFLNRITGSDGMTRGGVVPAVSLVDSDGNANGTGGSSIATLGTRPVIVEGVLTHGTTYAANASVGNLLTIATGLPAGTILTAAAFSLRATQGQLTTPSQINYTFFKGNPTASTFTDTVTAVLAAADTVNAMAAGASAFGAAPNLLAVSSANSAVRFPVDASGNIYIGIVAQASFVPASSNIIRWYFHGTY